VTTALLSAARSTRVPAPSSDTGVFVLLLVIIFLLAAGVVTLLLRRPRGRAAARRPDQPGWMVSGDTRGLDQRGILADTCMDVAEMLENDALTARLQLGLEQAGYEIVAPTGGRFDPKVHEAFARRPTDDPALELVVAATVRPGYRLDGQTIRQAKVVVYRVVSPPARG
jgi:molecular chaperone GrpE